MTRLVNCVSRCRFPGLDVLATPIPSHVALQSQYKVQGGELLGTKEAMKRGAVEPL